MQKLIKQTHLHPSQTKRSSDDPFDSSAYFVNNSFHCYLQPKRASVDIKLYLQLHKKILRKAIIEQKFQENIYVFEHSNSHNRKGFIGNARHDSLCRKTNTSQREKKRSLETIEKSTPTHLKSYQEKIFPEPFDQWIAMKTQTTPMKPSITHGVSIYRKKQRSKFERKQQSSFSGQVKQIPHQFHPGTKVKTVS